MTERDPESLVSRHRSAGCVVDTNLLLVYVVGTCDPKWIPFFKRTCAYTEQDFGLLAGFLHGFKAVVTTPNVLTEVSNLAGQIGDPRRQKAFAALRGLIGEVLDEQHQPSKDACRHVLFERLGLTDAVIAEIGSRGYLVLTDDFELCGQLGKAGLPALNFNHVRVLDVV